MKLGTERSIKCYTNTSLLNHRLNVLMRCYTVGESVFYIYHCNMNFFSLRTNPVFYIILSGFIILIFVEMPLLNNAINGKEKEFNDKLFNVVFNYEGILLRDTAQLNKITTDEAAIGFANGFIRRKLDSVFIRNDMPTDYVLAVGKMKKIPDEPVMTMLRRRWTNNKLIWSSDSLYNKGLTSTKLGIAGLGPRKDEIYYIKIFLPSKPSIIFNQLLPLIIVSVLALIILFICFIALIGIIRKQSRLAEIKHDFINNMTHELKTPLFTISIASKILGEQDSIKDNEKYVSYVESIKEESGRLTKMVEKVLLTSVLEQKQLPLERKEMDVHAAINSALASLELIKQELSVTIDLSLKAGSHTINADETHIMSVIYSLVDNAIKYSDGPAHITIATRNTGNDILISFTDKGIGFDVETKKLIFDRFFRANTGNLHKVKGYGIGLSYVKAIIETYDGTIVVNSVVGKGSEFILQLPCTN